MQAKNGDAVKVHYTGRLDEGMIFDSSKGGEPLEFTIGTGGVIPGFEEAVIGMKVGDSKTQHIPFDRAYGPRHEEMLLVVDRTEMPANVPLEIGSHLRVQHPEGHEFDVLIREINDALVTLDANHPLAGHDLIFDIELVQIGSRINLA